MPNPSLSYQLGDQQPQDVLVAALQESFQLQPDPATTVTRTYYDSFDWRLYLAQTTLVEEQRGRDHWLLWQGLTDPSPRESVRLAGPAPRFADDLPEGVMLSSIGPLLEMRALLPQLEVKAEQQTLRVLDDQQKTVLRLVIEQPKVRTPGRADSRSMAGLVRLQPVRGYPKPLVRVQAVLDKLGLTVVDQGALEAGLMTLSRQPADYSSKLNFRFRSGQPAVTAARTIHLQLLDTLERNLPGTREDIDSEFLHDLRVAVRRTRSALTQIKGVFSDADVERFKDRFAWIGQITGPTRDMDVYLLDFERYQASLPEQFRDDLEPLRGFLVAHQASEQRKMVKKLNSPHTRTLLKEWRTFLEAPAEQRQDAPNAELPVRQLADKRIYRVYRRVLEEGLAIRSASPPEALHELRKNCKKLRYLLEFFQSIYPLDEVKALVKALKQLLDNLGSFQDLEVQALKLREFAHQMVDEGEVPADTLLAMGMLVDGLLTRQQLAREEFAERFATFASDANRVVFKRLFADKRGNKR